MRELKQHGYNIVMTAVCASKEKCRGNGMSREIREGKKYNSISWSFAVDKISVCFRHAREMGFAQQTFFVTDNTDWSNLQTLIVPPQFSVKCYKKTESTKASRENRPASYSGEYQDTVPHFNLFCMPPSDFSNMHRILRSEVRLKVIKGNSDSTGHKTSLQICAHGRSLWFLYDLDSKDVFFCLNDRCSVIRGESPDADDVIKAEIEQVQDAEKNRSKWRSRKTSDIDHIDDPRENILIVYVREENPENLIRRMSSGSSPLPPRPIIANDDDDICLIVRTSSKEERDQWIDVIAQGLYAVRASTVEMLKQNVNEYLTSSERSRVTFIGLRKYIVERFGQVVFDVNADICEALVKRYLVTMA